MAIDKNAISSKNWFIQSVFNFIKDANVLKAIGKYSRYREFLAYPNKLQGFIKYIKDPIKEMENALKQRTCAQNVLQSMVMQGNGVTIYGNTWERH